MDMGSGKTSEAAGPALPVEFTLKDGRAAVLRTMSEKDAEELCALLPKMHAESDFLNYLPGEFDKTIEEERDYVREHIKPGSLALVAEVEGRIVAVGGAWSPPFARLAHHAELGLVVIAEMWGQGIGRKIMECIIEWGKQRGLRKLYLRVFDHNERAATMYRSLGFVEEGHLKGDVRRGDGTYGDTIIMARHYASRD